MPTGCYCPFIQDSLGFITPQRNDGRGLETLDYPGSYWEGMLLAMKNRGFTIYGSALTNKAQSNFASWNALGWHANYHTFTTIIAKTVTAISAAAAPVITCANHGLDNNDVVSFSATNSTPPLSGGPYTISTNKTTN